MARTPGQVLRRVAEYVPRTPYTRFRLGHDEMGLKMFCVVNLFIGINSISETHFPTFSECPTSAC